MELIAKDAELEELNRTLDDPRALADYARPYDAYRASFVPRALGAFLVGAGNLFYGREPSYLKFRAIEVIARIPYHSWASAAYTLLTLFYTSEERALALSAVSRYATLAQENETMHVVVISQLARGEARASWLRHTFVPLLFAFFYFWASYILYLCNRRWSFELNYLFEQHAFRQYSRFLEQEGEALKAKPVVSDFLEHYGRHPRSQYEFFRSVRNDELIHRNQSIAHIGR